MPPSIPPTRPKGRVTSLQRPHVPLTATRAAVAKGAGRVSRLGGLTAQPKQRFLLRHPTATHPCKIPPTVLQYCRFQRETHKGTAPLPLRLSESRSPAARAAAQTGAPTFILHRPIPDGGLRYQARKGENALRFKPGGTAKAPFVPAHGSAMAGSETGTFFIFGRRRGTTWPRKKRSRAL